jgi:hypothetical protein
MFTLPETYCTLISKFARVFSKRVWQHVQVLLIGALLAPGTRTITSVLRVMGLSDEQHFQNYHRVLSRAVWSSLEISRILLQLLVNTFVPKGPIVIGIDETIERRRGAKIKAKGIYRDPVRSSHSHFVKASGLRWLSAMLLVPIPWVQRVWALPFLTALSPSERYYTDQGRRPIRQAAWYDKPLPTFSGAIGLVRHQLWQAKSFHTSASDTEMQKVPRFLLNRFIDALCYAA